MILQFFWKNVNKQLKSADFFSEMWKFQKNLLNKNFPFFIQMWQHTFIFVVKLPNGRKSHANIHGLLLTAKCQPYLSTRQFFYILFVTSHFWILWEKIQKKLHSKSANVEKTTKQGENQQIFVVTLNEKFSMPDYWYMLYKFTQYTWALNSTLFWRI